MAADATFHCVVAEMRKANVVAVMSRALLKIEEVEEGTFIMVLDLYSLSSKNIVLGLVLLDFLLVRVLQFFFPSCCCSVDVLENRVCFEAKSNFVSKESSFFGFTFSSRGTFL